MHIEVLKFYTRMNLNEFNYSGGIEGFSEFLFESSDFFSEFGFSNPIRFLGNFSTKCTDSLL